MNLFRRLAGWASAVLARWEGAQRHPRDRGFIPGQYADAREDLDQFSRTELVLKSRYWEKNDGFTLRCADVWEQYTVGPKGLVFTPATSVPEFNALVTEGWNRFCELPDVSSRLSMGQLESLASYRWFWDGEISILKTRGASGRPRIQLIECQRIGNPDTAGANDSVHDGVRVDAKGRPLSYFIRDGFSDSSFREVPAEFVIRIFEPSRPGQLRGFPITSAVLNTIQDLDELQALEMRGAKDAGSRVWKFKRKGGTLDPMAFRKERIGLAGATSTGAQTTEQRDANFKRVVGGETVAMDIDEDMELFQSNRPSVAVQDYWDFLISKICIGIGIPRMLVLPKSLQGTVARAELDVSAAFFRSRSAVLIEAFRQVYIYWLGSEIQTNAALAKLAPKDWQKVNVRPPKTPNVDVGRNSGAMISELEAGTLTYESIYGESGEDWREQFRQRAIERAEVKALAEEFDIEPQEIAGLKMVASIPQEPAEQSPTAVPATSE